jgi:hypothetical protein
VREVTVTRATEAMLASASPRKPSVATRSRSASVAILLVAWRARASGVGALDAAPVVGHADPLDAAFVERDGNRPRTRVQAVLQQLLHHRGRSLDDLAGRDLADQRIGKKVDRGHCATSLRPRSRR